MSPNEAYPMPDPAVQGDLVRRLRKPLDDFDPTPMHSLQSPCSPGMAAYTFDAAADAIEHPEQERFGVNGLRLPSLLLDLRELEEEEQHTALALEAHNAIVYRVLRGLRTASERDETLQPESQRFNDDRGQNAP